MINLNRGEIWSNIILTGLSTNVLRSSGISIACLFTRIYSRNTRRLLGFFECSDSVKPENPSADLRLGLWTIFCMVNPCLDLFFFDDPCFFLLELVVGADSTTNSDTWPSFSFAVLLYFLFSNYFFSSPIISSYYKSQKKISIGSDHLYLECISSYYKSHKSAEILSSSYRYCFLDLYQIYACK